ncbi:DNA internalization-related competence protein ComEC/Rec2 [Paenibacillus pinisoli]|uniref:DNA internalization-related competence protein ComEC/Rec2 n=1 Tax=Paenibacillus pinisoli TaxID=1276110 RepID=A0A3A6PF11_9BACL|nr:DNA internalization-related competence protein ComEC/Rec2 [Paenibacillus pinisoli]RJX38246.1 DNA internalization-related competence protein ComEC/Rec2 [Paenibacillus pinisoli]
MTMNRRPLVWFAVCFVLGSSAAAGLGWRGTLYTAGAALLLTIAAILSRHGSRGLAIICLLGFCAAAGERLWADSRNVTELQELLAVAESDGPRAAYAVRISGTIISAVEVDGDRAQFRLEASSVQAAGDEPLAVRSERLMVQLRLAAQPEQEIAAAWQRGDQVRIDGELSLPAMATNSGGFDYRRYLRSQGIHWLLKSKGAAALAVEASAAEAFSAAAVYGRVDAARAWLGARLDYLYPAEQAGYMKGLVLGIREDLDPEQFNQFARLGLTHILAISGLHVGVFMYALTSLLKMLRQPRERILLILMAAVPFYVLLTGASPSVLRAGLMAMLGLAAARMGKLKDGLHLISAAAVVLLLFNPYLLNDVSFQLSFIVTLGLILGVPPLRRAMPKWRRGGWLLDLAAVTVVAQLVSFPVTIYYFNQFNLLSLLANFVLVPFISMIVMPAGAAALVLSVVWPWGAKRIADLSVLANDGSFAIIRWLADQSMFRQVWGTPPLWWVVVWLLLTGAVFRVLEGYRAGAMEISGTREQSEQEIETAPIDEHKQYGNWKQKEGKAFPVSEKRRTYRPFFIYLAVSILLLVYAYMPDAFDRRAAVSFLDVGQGDAALIRTASGKHILVDGGGAISFRKPGEEWRDRSDPFEVGSKVLVPLLRDRGVHRIDLMILSHMDTDHIKGLIAVIEEMPVRQIWWNGTLRPSEDSSRLMKAALRADIPMYAPLAGESRSLDKETHLEVLWPVERKPGIPVMKDQNEHSLVVAIQLYNSRFLFTGDISVKTESAIVRATRERNLAPQQPVDMMKIAHHGSRHSTGSEWLAYWRPAGAVASAGAANTYGHPHPDVLGRLREASVAVWRTDTGGEAKFRVNRLGIWTLQK